MDNLKIKIVPDWRDLNFVLKSIVVGFFTFGLLLGVYTCSEETYLMGYNKNMEEINQAMFEVDSLIMTIQMDLDSINARQANIRQ